jgi:predicted transcriptional regulator
MGRTWTLSEKRKPYQKMRKQEGYIKLDTLSLKKITGMSMPKLAKFLGVTRMSIYLALKPNRTVRCETYLKIQALVEQKLAEKKEKTND